MEGCLHANCLVFDDIRTELGGNCWIQKKKCQVVEHCFQKSEEILAFKRRKGVDGCCHIFAFDIMVQSMLHGSFILAQVPVSMCPTPVSF